MLHFPQLRSNRLILRQLELKDAHEIFHLRSDEGVNKYLDRPKAETIEDAIHFINRINDSIQKNNSFYWAISYNEGENLLGTICIWNIEDKKAEIGYELLPKHHGKGLMHEALQIVISYAFNQLNLDVILAVFHPDNQSSVRLLERSNFVLNTNEEDMVENMMVYKLEKDKKVSSIF